MLSEVGRVVGVEEDGLLVETINQSACEACSAKAGCGQKLLSQLHSSTLIKAYFMPSQARQSWSVGDQVELGIEPQALVGAALLAYMMPLGLMLIGVVVSPLVLSLFSASLPVVDRTPDVVSVLGAVVGLVCGGVLSRYFNLTCRSKQKFQAKVISKTIKAVNI